MLETKEKQFLDIEFFTASYDSSTYYSTIHYYLSDDTAFEIKF